MKKPHTLLYVIILDNLDLAFEGTFSDKEAERKQNQRNNGE